MSSTVAYRAVLPVDRSAVAWFSGKLAAHRRSRRRTRKGTRRLTPWSQAVYTLRWLIDGTRVAELATDNALPSSTAYEYLWEGLEVLAAHAPTLDAAIHAARAAGDEHIGLDGTLIPTNRVRIEGPTEGAELFYSGKHHRHGVNLQVISAPDGYPLWIGQARPGREHDTAAAYHTGVEAVASRVSFRTTFGTTYRVGPSESSSEFWTHPPRQRRRLLQVLVDAIARVQVVLKQAGTKIAESQVVPTEREGGPVSDAHGQSGDRPAQHRRPRR